MFGLARARDYVTYPIAQTAICPACDHWVSKCPKCGHL